jgi:hypothetical protein
MFGSDKIVMLEQSQLIEPLGQSLRMKPQEVLGMIATFMGLTHKYSYRFLDHLFDLRQIEEPLRKKIRFIIEFTNLDTWARMDSAILNQKNMSK